MNNVDKVNNISKNSLFRPPVYSPLINPHVYEKSWNGGGKIKIVESQEKKTTLHIQLCTNEKVYSKLTLQQ